MPWHKLFVERHGSMDNDTNGNDTNSWLADVAMPVVFDTPRLGKVSKVKVHGIYFQPVKSVDVGSAQTGGPRSFALHIKELPSQVHSDVPHCNGALIVGPWSENADGSHPYGGGYWSMHDGLYADEPFSFTPVNLPQLTLSVSTEFGNIEQVSYFNALLSVWTDDC